MKRRILAMAAASGLLAAASASVGAPPLADPPEALRHIDAARKLAGQDLKTPMFLCGRDANPIIGGWSRNATRWRQPTKLLDNLYFIGNEFVGTHVLRTSKGLILFDTLQTESDVKDHLVPGLIQLGLDPKTIRYAIITHAHWDHFGGTAYLQANYGTRIGFGAADWDLLARTTTSTASRPTPKRDLVVTDGQKLTLGDTTVTLYVTPGHTPGSVSALIPARDRGKVKVFSLFGGGAIPSTIAGNQQTGGLQNFSASVERFARLSRAAGAVGILDSHPAADGGLERMDAAASQDSTRPLLIGGDAVRRYYGLMDQCVKAAMARAVANPPAPGRWYQ